jgi:hypothetical protein
MSAHVVSRNRSRHRLRLIESRAVKSARTASPIRMSSTFTPGQFGVKEVVTMKATVAKSKPRSA